MPKISPKELQNILHYNPKTGIFIWLNPTSSRHKSFDTAGHYDKNGYVLISINREIYRAHRLAFFYMTGVWPSKSIDHMNGVRNDNRWCNLREVTSAQNHQNRRKAHSNNKYGLLGVSNHRGRIRSTINVNGKHVMLGYFDTPEDAHQAYLDAKRIYHTHCTI